MVHGAYDAASQGDFVLHESGRVLKGTFLVDDNYNLEEAGEHFENLDREIQISRDRIGGIQRKSDELNDRIDRMATEAARLKELAEKLEGKIKVFKL